MHKSEQMISAAKAALENWGTTSDAGTYAVQMWHHLLWLHSQDGRSDGSGALPYVAFKLSDYGLYLAADSCVLDIGCLGGYGLFDFYLHCKKNGHPVPGLTGVDLAEESIALGQFLAEKGVWGHEIAPQFVSASADALPYQGEAFDLVIARLLLPYVNIQATLKEMGRVVKPQGLVLVQLHAPGYYWQQVCRNRRRLRQLAYYFRPLLSGLFLRVTGKQPRSRFWRECAITPAMLRRFAARNGLVPCATAGDARRPVFLLKKVE